MSDHCVVARTLPPFCIALLIGLAPIRYALSFYVLLKIVVGIDDLTGVGSLDDGEASNDGLCALVYGGSNGSVVYKAIGKFLELCGCVVVVDINGDDNGLARCAVALFVRKVSLHCVGAVVEDKSTLGTVNESTHGVVALAARGNEYLGHLINYREFL